VPIMRVVCPECKAGMKNPDPAGFKVGDTVECPKCGTYFGVDAPAPAAKPAPAKAVSAKPAAKSQPVENDEERPKKKSKPPKDEDDEEEERPKKKSKARKDDDEDEEDEDEDDRPKNKKKKGKKSSDDGSYKKSPVRFIVLGVLVLIMLVAGGFLVRKVMKEREEANTPAPAPYNPDDDLGKPITKPGGRK